MSEFIEVLSPSALKDLQALNAEITKTVAGVKEVNNNMINVKTPSGADSAIKSLNNNLLQQDKTIKSLQKELQKEQNERKKTVQSILDQAKSYQSLQKQKENSIAQSEKEFQAALKSQNAYERVKQKIAETLPFYNNLATKQALGIKLSAEEIRQLSLLEGRMIKYREVLNSVNKSYGNFSLEVGNYAKANSNLSNSIGQISRELPNFGQSFQIGVLSLTNNIGALIDGIKQVKEQNKELSAQGQQTKSVFSQILSSLFSWQTALFVGIGIFSAYSDEISDLVKSLWEGNSALKANERAFVDAYDARMRYNGATSESTKKSQEEFNKFSLLIRGMKDVTKSQEERLNMAKRLKEQYPGYLKVFSEEQIVAYASGKANKELSKSMSQLTADIRERNLAMAESEEASKTFALAVDLKKEFEFRESQNKLINSSNKATRDFIKKRAEDRVELLNDSDEFIDKFGKTSIDELGNYNKFEINALKIRYNALVKEFNLQREDVNKKLINTSLLDFNPEKDNRTKKEKIALNFEEIESEYKLKQAILERRKAESESQMSNDSLGLDEQIKARERYSEISIQLLDLRLQKEKVLIADSALDDLAKNELALKNKELSQEQYLKNVVAINNRMLNEQSAADESYYKELNGLRESDLAFYKKIETEKREFSKKTEDFILSTSKDKFKKISEDEKNTLTTRQKAFEEYLRLAKKELDIQKIRELANAKSQEEIDFITQKYADLNRQLNEIKSPVIKAREETEKWIDSLVSDRIKKGLQDIGLSSLSMFLDLDKHGQSTFDKLIEGADTLKERFAITFQAVGDVAQDTFNKIIEMSNANFQNEYSNLERQRDIALQFAGESASAREEIERQAEQKRRNIQRREFQAKKQQALFNIAVDTAQAIIATLTRTPLPAGLPLVIATGALGAVQAGIVASQQMPAYWKGTDNAKEGWAWTQEKGREVILDKNGNVKSLGSDKGATATYLNKGDKVLTAEKTMDFLMFNDDLNNILTGSGINMPKVEVNNQGMTDSQVNAIVSAIKTKETTQISIDRRGIRDYVTNGNQITEKLNNRVTFKGTNV